MSMQLTTAGRVDVDEYFRLSGIREFKNLNHTPLLAFETSEVSVTVRIVDSADKLMDFPDETKVMAQWRGQWKSDFFQFTVGQFRSHITANPKKDYYVV
jgi:hypothetical protein